MANMQIYSFVKYTKRAMRVPIVRFKLPGWQVRCLARLWCEVLGVSRGENINKRRSGLQSVPKWQGDKIHWRHDLYLV